jgi:hypothetical protein
VRRGDAEEGGEGGEPGTTAVEAEAEPIEEIADARYPVMILDRDTRARPSGFPSWQS